MSSTTIAAALAILALVAGPAGLAATFDAERIRLRRYRMEDRDEIRRIDRAREAVIHERAGEELALRVVERALQHRLADPLHHSAVDLPLDQQRIDDGAKIIDGKIFHHLDMAGLRIDLDLGDMTAVRKGRRHAVADMTDVERLRAIGRQLHAAGAQLLRKLHDPNAAVGAGDAETPIGELDVARRGLQGM